MTEMGCKRPMKAMKLGADEELETFFLPLFQTEKGRRSSYNRY